MELKEEARKALAVLSQESKLPAAAFRQVVEAAITVLRSKRTEEEALASLLATRVDAAIVKSAFSALLLLFAEGAKLDLSSIEFGSIVEECILDKSRADFVCAQFEQGREAIRRTLSKSNGETHAFPELLDVEWRLDYVVRTSHLDGKNEPLYTVRFLTSRPPASGEAQADRSHVEFMCTVQQLQDMVAKLKDATKQFERTLGSLSS